MTTPNAPDVLSPRLRTLNLLRETLATIQQRAPSDDVVLGRQIADCLEIVDDGIREALQEQRADLAGQLSASVRLSHVERDVRTIREHLGIGRQSA